MNIVIFSWRGPGHPNAGGAEIVTHEHAKAWVKSGHNVTLFTSFFPGASKEETTEGIRIIRKGVGLTGVHLEAWKWYRGLEVKPDLVFDHFHGIPFFTPLYVKEKKVAFIHEVAKEVWFLNHLPFPKNLIYGLVGYLCEPLIFELYKNIPFITVSESTKEDLEKWGVRKITVIHNGIILPKPEIRDQKSKVKTAIYLGTLAKDKGIEDAIKAFALINRKEKGWQFWVVGRGNPDYLRELKVTSGDLKVKVKFWGYVSEKEKFQLLAKAWVMVNPSVREGWGLVNLEANSQGTPVAGYKVPGMIDSVINGKTGQLSACGDYRSLAANTLKLVGNPVLYAAFQKNSLAWAKNFSWEKAGKESLRLIEELYRK